MSKGLPGSAAWQMAQKFVVKLVLLLIVRGIPMLFLRRKSCSEAHLWPGYRESAGRCGRIDF